MHNIHEKNVHLVQLRRDLLNKKENILQKLTWDDEEYNTYFDSRMRGFTLKLAFVTRSEGSSKQRTTNI